MQKSPEEVAAMAARWKRAAAKSTDTATLPAPATVQTQQAAQKAVEQESPKRTPIPAFKIPPDAEKALAERTNGFSVHFEEKDFSDKTVSPYAPNNKYNYNINISHPAIYPQFLEFKKAIGENMILSDQQRYDFEYFIQSELTRLDIRQTDFPEKPKESRKQFNNSYNR